LDFKKIISMRVWILQTGEPLHIDEGNPRPMRAMNLANTLVNKGHKVTLWSSGFYHQEKRHRSKNFKRIRINDKLEIRLIPSPGYKRNVSISRLIDHFVLALNLQRQLDLQRVLPDVAFLGYPPIESAFVMTQWLKKRKIPCMLDVKDQWPSVLVQSAPKLIQPVARFILSPYYSIAKKTMRDSTGICTMSDGFINWSLEFFNRAKNDFDFIAPLTSPNEFLTDTQVEEAVLWWSKKGIENNGSCRIMFVGSFSRAFDFDTIFIVANKLSEKNINCEFVLCGYGELVHNLQAKASKCRNVKVIEWIDSSKIVALSQMSTAFIAPYKNSPDFIISIPNKIIDALRLGLLLLSPLKGEVANLIKSNKVGFTYNDSESLSVYIQSLIDNYKLQEKISTNAKELYNKEFEFNKIYDGLVSHLENMRIKR
jgi:glycosyltransferase involved in cell wall biosynthesis